MQATKDKTTPATPPPSKPIIRDFAYEPKPQIIEWPIVDQDWVVSLDLPEMPIPGLRERRAKEWERSHSYLFQSQGNCADPPNTIPKTWGRLSKEDNYERECQVREYVWKLESADQE
ncbi:hypothetical protein K439DRAFT_1619487 [Ramaria rubella]|nr:hypothetical protein K439DRAFT_1619487 [Ramaria rubella]